jgi:hypothetical protein
MLTLIPEFSRSPDAHRSSPLWHGAEHPHILVGNRDIVKNQVLLHPFKMCRFRKYRNSFLTVKTSRDAECWCQLLRKDPIADSHLSASSDRAPRLSWIPSHGNTHKQPPVNSRMQLELINCGTYPYSEEDFPGDAAGN